MLCDTATLVNPRTGIWISREIKTAPGLNSGHSFTRQHIFLPVEPGTFSLTWTCSSLKMKPEFLSFETLSDGPSSLAYLRSRTQHSILLPSQILPPTCHMYTSHSLVPVLPELCCCAPFNILWTRFRLRTWRTPNKNLSKRQFWISQSFSAGAEFTLGNPDHWVQVRHPQVLGNPPRRLTNKSRIGNTNRFWLPAPNKLPLPMTKGKQENEVRMAPSEPLR